MIADTFKNAVKEALLPISILDGELAEFCEALTAPPPPAIRLQGTACRDDLPFSTSICDWSERGFYLPDGVQPGRLIPYGTGDYYIQDASSLLAVELLCPQQGEMILDLCSSPGGKATAVLDKLDGTGCLVANEVVQSRVAPLTLNLMRQGCANWIGTSVDPKVLAKHWAGLFDAVLVDAPCSGQSLLGRGKQTHAAFEPNTVTHCAARQSRILREAGELVQPGGRLVYSTCTFSPEENENLIRSFLESSPFRVEPDKSFGEYESPLMEGAYRLWPHRHQGAGTFAIRLRKAEQVDHNPVARKRKQSRKAAISRNEIDQLRRDLEKWGEVDIKSHRFFDRRWVGWPDDMEVFSNAPFVTAGPDVAERRGQTWVPAYALAMRKDRSFQPKQVRDLDEQSAKAYLAGELIPGDEKGWTVVTWRHRPLGWAKGDGKRLKNHLPKSARIAVLS